METSADKNIANDYKVVSFRNAESFDFTPEMGCMYDGRAINGSSGKPGIEAGETKMLPYHVGFRIATNLAKQAMVRAAGNKQEVDAQGNPMVKAMWDDTAVEALKHAYITEMYSEDKPAAQTETDKLFARIAALEALVGTDKPKEDDVTEPVVVEPAAPTAQAQGANEPQAVAAIPAQAEDPTTSFKDKAEVLAELEKRNIQHDKRASKASLEALLK